MSYLTVTGTHFHQGEIVVYETVKGCPFQYREHVECPACGGEHLCGKGC